MWTGFISFGIMISGGTFLRINKSSISRERRGFLTEVIKEL
jgi:hypothetical protein